MFEVAARINNVQYNPTKPIAAPGSTGSSSSSSGQTTSRPLGNGGTSVFGVVSYEMIFSLVSALVAMAVGPCLLLL